jgi:hypothetical protein
VRSQLDTLDQTALRGGLTNTFAATQIVNGGAGDQSAVLKTTAAPTARKLLWEIALGGYALRLYATTRTLEITLNARWDGAQWVKDGASFWAVRFDLNNFQLRVQAEGSTNGTFADAAFVGGFVLPIGATGPGISVDFFGNWAAPGFTESYAGWQGQSPPSGNLNVGTGVSFRKVFLATPSSVSFVVLDSLNISGTPLATSLTPCGLGAVATAAAPNANTRFYARVLVT